MAIIELVDFNENMLADKAATKTSRRRRGGSKKKTEVEKVETVATEDAEVVAEEKEKLVKYEAMLAQVKTQITTLKNQMVV